MFCRAEDRPERIVVELNEIWSPTQEHRELRLQQDADCRAETLRPSFNRTDWRVAPVDFPRERPHLAPAAEDVKDAAARNSNAGRGAVGIHASMLPQYDSASTVNNSPGSVRTSILLPAFNAAKTITNALASVRGQSDAAWECVVVDDGSSDETAALVSQAARLDSRIRLVQRPHRGLVEALNEGLRHCRAPLIVRMDADDVMRRDRLAAQAAALDADPTLSAVGCHVRIFPRHGLSPRLREYETWLNSLRSADDVNRDAFVECPIAHPSLMMRRGMASLAYRDAGWPEDYDLVLRALEAGLRIGVVAKRLLMWRDRADSLSRTSNLYDVERFTACKAHYLVQRFLARHAEYVLWGYGATGRSLRRALLRYGKNPSHIVEVKRSRIGQRIHDAPVISIDELHALRGQPIIVSVARAAPRHEIRTAMAAMQFVEGVDFVCCA